MANLDNLFREFNAELCITATKKSKMISSKDHLRNKIKDHFKENHPGYTPKFYIQGSYKLKTSIRTKEDTCDLDDGIYFESNPDNVTGTTLQKWVKEAVDGTTDATPIHKRKCIRVDYKEGYNIDLPVMVFDEENDEHPMLAVKNDEFQLDDPKEFVDYFQENKTDQMVRIIKYLKSWCDHIRNEMPCGLAMTVLALDNFQPNQRDDISLKYTLIEIEKSLKQCFECQMPTTPYDDLFADYSETKKKNFLDNLRAFIEDAKKAIDESNQLKASKLWRKHLGDRFPLGDDKEDESSSNFTRVAENSRPYFQW